MFALVATSSASKTKRGIFGSPQADAAHGIVVSGGNGYSGAGHDFGSAGQSYSNAGQDFGNAGQVFGSVGQDLSSAGQGSFNAGQDYSAARSYNYQQPESIQTQRSESTERQKYPVEVQRTIVKTVHVERPVPQVSSIAASINKSNNQSKKITIYLIYSRHTRSSRLFLNHILLNVSDPL